MKLLLVLLLGLVNLCVAPFPEDHPYNWANPLIEPWWLKLEPETQKKVYAQWRQVEPFAKAVAIWKERLVRTAGAYGSATAAGSAAYLAGAKQLGNTLLGYEDTLYQEEAHTGEGGDGEDFAAYVEGAKQIGKALIDHDLDLFDHDDSSPEEAHKASKPGKTRFKSEAQGKWEDFQAAQQLASVQLFKAERAKYQTLLEAARLVRQKKDDLFFSDDESWLQQFQDNLKIQSLQLQDQVNDYVDSGKEGVIDSKEELFKKVQKGEAQIRDFLSNTKEEIRRKLWMNHVIDKRK